jgi:predicted Fe-Mo cluster-binding NifX family protein
VKTTSALRTYVERDAAVRRAGEVAATAMAAVMVDRSPARSAVADVANGAAVAVEQERTVARVVITIQGEGDGLGAMLDERFGRAPRFLVVETESGDVLQTVANEAAGAAQGAGPRAASLVAELGATAVISGRFGPKAMDAIKGFGIEGWCAPGGITAGEALDRFRRDDLQRTEPVVFR